MFEASNIAAAFVSSTRYAKKTQGRGGGGEKGHGAIGIQIMPSNGGDPVGGVKLNHHNCTTIIFRNANAVRGQTASRDQEFRIYQKNGAGNRTIAGADGGGIRLLSGEYLEPAVCLHAVLADIQSAQLFIFRDTDAYSRLQNPEYERGRRKAQYSGSDDPDQLRDE